MPKTSDFIIAFLSIFVLGVFVGGRISEETTISKVYYRDKEICLEKLPRNLKCKVVKVAFEEVEIEK